MAPPRFIPTALPIARRLPEPKRVEPPPLPGQRNLDRLGTGADYRSHRLTGITEVQGAPVNAWVDVVSTWVLRSRFDMQEGASTGDWMVEFLDGSLVVYRNTTPDVWGDFFNSPSKGLFIHYRCAVVGRAYDTLRGPQRVVTDKHRKLRDVLRNEGRPRR